MTKTDTDLINCTDCGTEGPRGEWAGEGKIVASKHAGEPVCDSCEDGRDAAAAAGIQRGASDDAVRAAIAAAEAVPMAQDSCWPGSDDHICSRTNHAAAQAAVDATEDVATWDFRGWAAWAENAKLALAHRQIARSI